MKNKYLYLIWGGMFIVCAVLGFIRDAQESRSWLFTLAGLLFFLPPVWLVCRGGDRDRRLVRLLSASSLLASAAGLCLNFLSVRWSEAAGQILYSALTIVSVPMVCCGYWALSLFCWAALWIAAGKRKNP